LRQSEPRTGQEIVLGRGSSYLPGAFGLRHAQAGNASSVSEVPDTVKGLRLRAAMSLPELAAELGIPEQELEQLEKMTVLPDRWCLQFAAYFGVRPEDIRGCAS
jgi:DNA-binding XRE family transcriptional regulator